MRLSNQLAFIVSIVYFTLNKEDEINTLLCKRAKNWCIFRGGEVSGSPRSHPRHLVGKKDRTKKTPSAIPPATARRTAISHTGSHRLA